MKHLDLETFSDFSCIGSACPFTCCAGWAIQIDHETDSYYRSVTGDFSKRLAAGISRQEGKYSSFINTPEGNCPFLNEDKLCDIYINLGEEHLCYTCKKYPRYNFTSGDISFSGVSISCPEVSRFYLSRQQPLKIDFTEDTAPVPDEADVDWTLFNHSIRCFTSCIAIAQNRSLTISERLASLILFISEFQSQIDNKEDPSELIQLFSDPLAYPEILKDTCIYQKDFGSKIHFALTLLVFSKNAGTFNRFIPTFSELYEYFFATDNTIDPVKFLTACDALKSSEEQIWQEQLITYGLYRYFMQGFEKRDFYEKFLISFVLIYLFSIYTILLQFIQKGSMPSFEDKLMIVTRMSRIIEHTTNICDYALEQLRGNGLLDLLSLLKIVS